MTDHFASRAQFLAAYAEEKGISWKQDAQHLPKGDHFARLGFLADRLGISFALALDETLTKETLHNLSNKKDHARIS